jgi:SAM-dependent methyltransferase
VAEPAPWGLRRTLLDLTDKLHLARPVVRGYELALAARSGLRRDGEGLADDGLALPPARLRVQAGPRHADARFFLRSGRDHAELIRSLLAEGGNPVESLPAMLDWGCGCGRVLRHWSSLPKTQVYGCDINPRMVGWCRDNLPFAEVEFNDVSPPLTYDDTSFDLVYAFSVMTHLPVELQHGWMRECRRVLKPGGYLLLTTLGAYYLTRNRLSEAERQRFLDGDVVVLYEGSPGTSLCSAYHPPEYVQHELAADFELVTFRPAADDGRHDIHLLRKP